MASAKDISVVAAVVAVSSELDGMFTLKEEHKGGAEGFGDLHNVIPLCS